MNGGRPLDGVLVLELGNYIAAPTAGRLLADFGADVIKIERPGSGDEIRSWRSYADATPMLHHVVNRGKRSVALDLRRPAGRAAVLELAKRADVLLENFRPGTLERWGLGPADLDAVNADLILARISAFGQTGPRAGRPGFAAVAEAVGGLRHLVGEPDRPPARVGVSIGDSIAGLYAAFGVVMALFRRETRRAAAGGCADRPERVIDVALSEAVLSMMESLIPDHLAYGAERTRLGGRLEGIAPSNAYPCSDGTDVVVAGNGDAIFRRLMAVIGRPDLGTDPALVTNAGRWQARDRLDDAIAAWTVRLPHTAVLGALDAAGVPAGPVNTAADIVADPQFRARDMIQYRLVDVGAGTLREIGFPGVVPVLGDRSLPIEALGAEVGQHTAEVLGGMLGWGPDDIAALAEPDPATP